MAPSSLWVLGFDLRRAVNSAANHPVGFAENHHYGCAALPIWRHAPAVRSAIAERIHPLDVPGHCNEAPLAADIVEPAQQELAESHHRFDDPEHRFRGLFAQSVEFSS